MCFEHDLNGLLFLLILFFIFLCSQDKSVAFKIFELGLKKYGDIPEYILAYIDYLSHLNGEDDQPYLGDPLFKGKIQSQSVHIPVL